MRKNWCKKMANTMKIKTGSFHTREAKLKEGFMDQTKQR